jgi:hypothetical protein
MDKRLFVLLMASLLLSSAACSDGESASDAGVPEADSGMTADAGPTCDPSRCLAGNICVQNRCMLSCARHTGCPVGYDCEEIESQLVCAPNGKEIGPGQFGTDCGLDGDADCDSSKGFVCIGGQDDPDAYCSKSNCSSDADCPGNYYCKEIDRDDGSVLAVCLKRGYCAPAGSLVDCNDSDAVFAKDDQGNGYCSRSCPGRDPNDCGESNGCYPAEDGGFRCQPRAGTCLPQGTFCSRCLSRNDCPAGGFCYVDTFSKEHMCAQPCSQEAPCPASPDGIQGSCYSSTTGAWEGGACLPTPFSDYDPPRCWVPCPATGCPQE